MNRTERREQVETPSSEARVRDTIAQYHDERPKLKLVEEPPERKKSDREKNLDKALGEVPGKKQKPAEPKPVDTPAEPEEAAKTNVVPGLAPSLEQAPTKTQAEALEATDLDPQDSAERREITDPAGAAETEQDAGQHILSRDSRRSA